MHNTLTVHTANADETRALAAQLGARLGGGEIIALHGDLGAGKTTFVQGLLQGMGSRDRVTSPTFTLVNVYQTARALEVHHVDAYRLGSAARTAPIHNAQNAPDLDADLDADLEAESMALDDLLGAPQVVVIIEWAERVPSLSHAATLEITLTSAESLSQAAEDANPDKRTIAMRAHHAHGDQLLHDFSPYRK